MNTDCTLIILKSISDHWFNKDSITTGVAGAAVALKYLAEKGKNKIRLKGHWTSVSSTL